MIDLEGLDPQWGWLALGVVLATAEMLVPGYFLIWLAAAAIVTGLLAMATPIPLTIQIALFAVLSVAAVLVGKRWLRDNPIEAADPLMNDRGGRLVGETVVVTQVIAGGTGWVHHGDSEWGVRGPDAEPGTRMRVSGHDGAVLIVEHLN